MDASEPKISIILPTYNEAGNIITLIEQIASQVNSKNFELIVVDDNSPDGTSGIVNKEKHRFPELRLITRTAERGLVPSIRDGIKASTGSICLWMDADLSMDPALIPQFLVQIGSGADLVLGSRYIPGGGIKGVDPNVKKTSLFKIWNNLRVSEDSFVSAMISILGNRVIRIILNSSLHDFSSGYFCGKKNLFSEIEPEGNIVDYCISLPYRAIMKGYKVVEIPMVLLPRKHGVSKTSNNIESILKVAYQCFKKAFILRFKIKDERNKQL